MRISEDVLGYLEKHNNKYPERVVILCHAQFFKTIENKHFGKFIYYVLTKDLEAASRLKSSIHRNEIMQYGVRVISLRNEFKDFLAHTPSIDAIVLNDEMYNCFSLIIKYVNNIKNDKRIILVGDISDNIPGMGKLNIVNTDKINKRWICRICKGFGKPATPVTEHKSKFKEQELGNEEYENE